mmetsp:Transcript_107225/g.313539  ORF Transcript_107225/g.313539 Transcript_107225/m.313539 type:complete len:389 (-) Transcript_107225:291-1457(-)
MGSPGVMRLCPAPTGSARAASPHKVLESLEVDLFAAHLEGDLLDVCLVHVQVPQGHRNLLRAQLAAFVLVNLLELLLQLRVRHAAEGRGESDAHQAPGHAHDELLRCSSERPEDGDVVDLREVRHGHLVVSNADAGDVRLRLALDQCLELRGVERVLLHAAHEILDVALRLAHLPQRVRNLGLVQGAAPVLVDLLERRVDLRVRHGPEAEGAAEAVREERREVPDHRGVVDGGGRHRLHQGLEGVEVQLLRAHGVRDLLDVCLVHPEAAQRHGDLLGVELPALVRVERDELLLQLVVAEAPEGRAEGRAHEAPGQAREEVLCGAREGAQHRHVVDLLEVRQGHAVGPDTHVRDVRLRGAPDDGRELAERERVLLHAVHDLLDRALGLA